MKKILKVEGMTCGHCAERVTKALESVEGVTKAEIDLKKKTAAVELGAEVADEKLIAAVVEASYEVKKIS